MKFVTFTATKVSHQQNGFRQTKGTHLKICSVIEL